MLVSIWQALLSFSLVAGLLTLVPGLDTTLVLRGTLGRSRRYGFSALAGIQAGVLVWGVAAAVGAAALLAASHTAYTVLCYVGAAYMVWLGVSLIIKTFRRGAAPLGVDGTGVDETAQARAAERGAGLGAGFLQGLVTNLLNPKVGAFYIATLPQFVPAGVSPLAMGLLLAGVHCLLGVLWLGAVVLGADRVRGQLSRPAFARWIDRVTGGVLVAFGARLALVR